MMNGTMRALVKPHGKPGLELREVPVPRPGPRDVLIRLRATSICGSDVHIYDNDPVFRDRIKDGNISGHELCGEVVETGELVTGASVGDIVAIESHVMCGTCWYCRNGKNNLCENTRTIGIDRDGGFADYIAIPEQNAIVKPAGVSVEEAALLEPFGNALDSVTCVDVVGKSVLVTGLGPQGVMAMAIAKAAGARRVLATEVHARRRDFARSVMSLHASPYRRSEDAILDAADPRVVDAIREVTDGLGVDVVVEMSGHPNAIHTAFSALRSGGDYVALGLPGSDVQIDWSHHVVIRGITIHGIYGRHVYQTWSKARELLDSGAVNLKPLITHRFALEDYEEAFRLLKQGQAEKVILYPDAAR